MGSSHSKIRRASTFSSVRTDGSIPYQVYQVRGGMAEIKALSEELKSQLRDGEVPDDADVTIVYVLHFTNSTNKLLTATQLR